MIINIWNNPPEEIQAQIDEVRGRMILSKQGEIRQCIENCGIALNEDPLLKGAIRTNKWDQRKDIVKDLGWEREEPALNDIDLHYIRSYLEKFYGQSNEQNIISALEVTANENAYHPLKEYIEEVQWDGKERIRHALHHFLGAEEDELTVECFKVFLIGALNRIYRPGCKFDIMLCLVGEQGIGKSSFFRALALQDRWFTDDLKRLDDVNVYRKLQGHWIVEMAEMLGTANAKSIETVKAFITQQSDNYKIPYDRMARNIPRKCVFVGSSNRLQFLDLDRSGARRFYPIMTDMGRAEVHPLDDTTATHEYMRQLWAEALVLYKQCNGEYFLRKDLEKKLEGHRESFMAEDVNAGSIQAWLDRTNERFVCTFMIYNRVYNGFGRPDSTVTAEINDIMNHSIIGWKKGPKHRFSEPYGFQRTWIREDDPYEPCNEDGKTEEAETAE